jgi:Calx-beta domain/Carboxypeptidase regulatory-like domain
MSRNHPRTSVAKHPFLIAAVLLGLMSWPTSLYSKQVEPLAQEAFNISGRIINPSNNGVPDVTITLTLKQGSTTTETRTFLTDANGNYSFTNLPTGQNEARIDPTKLGYTFSPTARSIVSTRSLSGDFKVDDFTAVPEGTPVPTFQFSHSAYTVNENVSAIGITVTRKGEINAAATVGYFTSNMTAQSGLDYSPANGTLSFASGEVSKSFVIFIANDNLDEADETVSLSLVSPSGAGATLSSPATAVLTIIDDDPAPVISINNSSVTEGNTGTTNLTFTASLSAASGLPVSVAYATSDATATAGSDYTAASGTLTFSPGVTSRTVSVSINGDLTPEADETFTLNLSNPINATLASSAITATILNDDLAPPSLQLTQSSYTAAESAAFINISVTRTGDASAPATVKYSTSDTTDANYRCDQLIGVASRKCDYHIAAGTLRFAAGESTKQFSLSLINDAYVEGPESFTLTLSNPSGASLGQNSTASVTITDDDQAGAPNPINDTSFFVRQLYVDLLSREPDPAGWQGWTTRIDQCGQPGQPPPPCDRVTVGGDGFLRSGEFFDRQFFVLRLYRTGLGRILRYDEVADLVYVSGFLTDADLELNKQELVSELVARPEFSTRYNPLSNAAYVATLLQTAGVTVPQTVQDAWVSALDSGSKTRAQVFREVSERAEVSSKYLHEAQVVSAYYGFFTRNPDGAYLNYLQRLDSGEITLSDLANAFINAQEYRQRFGQ